MMYPRTLLTALLAFAPAIAHAYTSPSAVANTVSNGLRAIFLSGNSMYPSSGFVGIVLQLENQILGLLYVIGVFLFVRAGLRLINSQDEDKLNRAKRTIASTIVGIMMAHLTLRLVAAFYTPGGALNPEVGAQILSLEIAGILNWLASLAAVLAILMLVAEAIKAVSSFGKEDGTKEMKETVYGTVLGIGMIVVSGAIKLALGLMPGAVPVAYPANPDPTPAILRGVEVLMYILSFLALVAIGIIVYAGILMIISPGNDDQYSKAKGIITRAVIGLLVILLSSTLLYFILTIFENSVS